MFCMSPRDPSEHLFVSDQCFMLVSTSPRSGAADGLPPDAPPLEPMSHHTGFTVMDFIGVLLVWIVAIVLVGAILSAC